MTLAEEFRTGDTPPPDIIILTHKLARDYVLGAEVVRTHEPDIAGHAARVITLRDGLVATDQLKAA